MSLEIRTTDGKLVDILTDDSNTDTVSENILNSGIHNDTVVNTKKSWISKIFGV